MFPLTLSFVDNEVDYLQKKRRDSAADFLNNCYGWRCVEKLINKYWKKVTKHSLIPAIEEIVFELKNKNIVEDNKFYFYDTDHNIFHIPHPSSKILVHSTPCKDYLYVLNKTGFHIRRIWKLWDPESSDWTSTYINESLCDVYQVIERLASIEEFSDDHVKHGSRHSLEFYRSFDFEIPFPNKRIHGDYRDGGYILSFMYHDQKVEGIQYSFKELELISSDYIPDILNELELDV